MSSPGVILSEITRHPKGKMTAEFAGKKVYERFFSSPNLALGIGRQPLVAKGEAVSCVGRRPHIGEMIEKKGFEKGFSD